MPSVQWTACVGSRENSCCSSSIVQLSIRISDKCLMDWQSTQYFDITLISQFTFLRTLFPVEADELCIKSRVLRGSSSKFLPIWNLNQIRQGQKKNSQIETRTKSDRNKNSQIETRTKSDRKNPSNWYPNQIRQKKTVKLIPESNQTEKSRQIATRPDSLQLEGKEN